MKVFALLASLALVSAKSIKIDEIEYGFCGKLQKLKDCPMYMILIPEGAAQPGTIDEIVVEPFPIKLHTGESSSVLATLTLNEPVPVGARLKLDLKKEGLIPFPIPCLEIDGLHIGSWLV